MTGRFEHRSSCAFCGGKETVKFIEMGDMPLAGGYITEDQIASEKLYPLDVYFCRDCKLVQLMDIVPRDVLFDEYFYLSSTTKTLSSHFAELAKELKERFLKDGSLVVEIGSNDGVFLRPMEKMGAKAVGFEPSKNVSKMASDAGLEVVNDYFTQKSAARAAEKYGKADLVSASNVFAHIDDLHDVVEGVRTVLKDDGIFVFEVHYLTDLIDKMQYDTIYHEHMYYHSATALKSLFERHGMEIFDVQRIPIHEGSIRVFVKKSEDGKRSVLSSVKEITDLEREKGLDVAETFLKFGEKVRAHREELVGLLKKIRMENKSIVGYGAPGRGNTLLNYCKIGKDVLDYVTDESPTRKGKLIPGMHIPIVPPERIRETNPEYALMIAWSYKEEIIEKEKAFLEGGGKFIVPLPSPAVISRETVK